MTETQKNIKRPPIVVVVGHVDHGKTSLLDYIRHATVAAKEAGGITQSVGAYETIYNGNKITFIDTPGHEAFSKMRVRGTAIADIAILVVAAEEGVKPQTKEAIKVLHESKTPFVVAITKIDKSGADIERIKSDLAANDVLLEGYGGSVSFQPVSSKTGEGVGELLELIALTAEMEGLVYDPEVRATGVILESKKDKKRGLTVSVILKDGVLKIGDQIATATAKGKIKILENFLEEKVDSLVPSSPAVIIGFEGLPKIGEEFVSGDLTKEEIEKVEAKNNCPDLKKRFCKIDGDCVVKIMLKADVSGSLEALSELIHKVPKKETYQLEIISEGVGEISDGDVKSAIATDAIVLGFKVGLNKAAENMAKDNKVRVITSEIIYELIDAIENYFKCLSSGDMTGDLEILAVFGKKAGKQIVGGRVVTGEIKNNAILEVHEAGKSIGSCKVVNLQEGKIDAASVAAGKECGLLVSCEIEIKPQHHLIMR